MPRMVFRTGLSLCLKSSAGDEILTAAAATLQSPVLETARPAYLFCRVIEVIEAKDLGLRTLFLCAIETPEMKKPTPVLESDLLPDNLTDGECA